MKTDKFYNLDNHLNSLNNRRNGKPEEDLFLDNEEEPDEDQISGSGDRPVRRPDAERSSQAGRRSENVSPRGTTGRQSDFLTDKKVTATIR